MLLFGVILLNFLQFIIDFLIIRLHLEVLFNLLN